MSERSITSTNRSQPQSYSLASRLISLYRLRCSKRGNSQKQADELLHCLLPEAAAEEIRNIGTVIPRRYNNVAVLFCDVVNFTSYCDKHEPEEVVSRLDALFVAFERVAAAHGLEKIKTIGDAFMAAAGLLKSANDPLEFGGALRSPDGSNVD